MTLEKLRQFGRSFIYNIRSKGPSERGEARGSSSISCSSSCTFNQGLSIGVKANPALLLRFFAVLALGRDTAEPSLEPD